MSFDSEPGIIFQVISLTNGMYLGKIIFNMLIIIKVNIK